MLDVFLARCVEAVKLAMSSVEKFASSLSPFAPLGLFSHLEDQVLLEAICRYMFCLRACVFQALRLEDLK